MLFDEYDLKILDSEDSAEYFTEILQCYYSRNYRAAVTLLYSLVIYDLLKKLQDMAEDGTKSAAQKLEKLDRKFDSAVKYSEIENDVIEYFKKECSMYFKYFEDDVEYLKRLRNQSSHLNLRAERLFSPKDYQVKMLICSMFENVLSVKAPLLLDITKTHAKQIKEVVDNNYIYWEFLPSKSKITTIKNRFPNRMTDDAIVRSYASLLHHLFMSKDEEWTHNQNSLYYFIWAFTEYIFERGKSHLLDDQKIMNIFNLILNEETNLSENHEQVLIGLTSEFPKYIDLVRENKNLFTSISNTILKVPKYFPTYLRYYPDIRDTMFQYFLKNEQYHQSINIRDWYSVLSKENDFDCDQFFIKMAESIPRYNGFNAADHFMGFFLEHIEECSNESLMEIKKIYNKNNQCTGRGQHPADYKEFKKHLESRKLEI